MTKYHFDGYRYDKASQNRKLFAAYHKMASSGPCFTLIPSDCQVIQSQQKRRGPGYGPGLIASLKECEDIEHAVFIASFIARAKDKIANLDGYLQPVISGVTHGDVS